MVKNKYYIDVAMGEISLVPLNGMHFEIEATKEDISRLRRIFDEIHSANLGTYIRSHIPFVEYHFDSANDLYDEGYRQVYKMIYQLSNDTIKKQIESMGILELEDKDHL